MDKGKEAFGESSMNNDQVKLLVLETLHPLVSQGLDANRLHVAVDGSHSGVWIRGEKVWHFIEYLDVGHNHHSDVWSPFGRFVP